MKDFLQDTERRARFLGEYIVENKQRAIYESQIHTGNKQIRTPYQRW